MHPLNPESSGYGYQRFVEMYKYIFLFLLRIQLTATLYLFLSLCNLGDSTAAFMVLRNP